MTFVVGWTIKAKTDTMSTDSRTTFIIIMVLAWRTKFFSSFAPRTTFRCAIILKSWPGAVGSHWAIVDHVVVGVSALNAMSTTTQGWTSGHVWTNPGGRIIGIHDVQAHWLGCVQATIISPTPSTGYLKQSLTLIHCIYTCIQHLD